MGDNQYPPQPSPIREGRNAASLFTLHFSLKQRAAFTLAEVLITLGVIGVVAALTMPSLIANYQKKVWVNQLKTTYSKLNEGFRQIMAQEGCTDLICAGLMDSSYNFVFNESNINKIVTTLKLSNVATPSNSNSIYDYEISAVNKTHLGLFSNLGTSSTYSQYLHGTSPDGVIIGIAFPTNVGNSNPIMILLDINGFKKPNVYGRDVFCLTLIDTGQVVNMYSRASMILLAKKGVKPNPNPDLSLIDAQLESYKELIKQDCNPSSETIIMGGLTCADLIINDGWEMNY